MTNLCPYERQMFGSNKDDRISLSILIALGFLAFKKIRMIREHRYQRIYIIFFLESMFQLPFSSDHD